MARIRTIKPEFWTSEQVAECSTTARLLFIGLWNFCDDFGRHQASAKRLKMEIFPADNCKDKDIEGWVSELLRVGLIRAYTVDGKHFWQVTGWHHQKIEKPSARHPTPEKFDDHSTTVRQPFADQTPAEGKGMEGSLKEGNGRDAICTETAEPSSVPVAAASDSSEETLLTFPCDGSQREWTFTESYAVELTEAYPSLDVRSEARKALQWVRADLSRKKTAGGMKKFLVNWLNRATNGGGTRAGPHSGNRPTRNSTPPRLPT